MDYLVVHSGDAEGPDSLHAPLPLRAGELLVRRGLIEKGLVLMMSRGLVQRIPEQDGFKYIAGETAAPFIATLSTDYFLRLIERATWAVNRFDGVPTVEVSRFTHQLFEKWSTEFQSVRTLGDNQ